MQGLPGSGAQRRALGWSVIVWVAVYGCGWAQGLWMTGLCEGRRGSGWRGRPLGLKRDRGGRGRKAGTVTKDRRVYWGVDGLLGLPSWAPREGHLQP